MSLWRGVCSKIGYQYCQMLIGDLSNTSTWVRHMSRARAENVRRISPRVSRQEAFAIASDLYQLLRRNPPLTVGGVWSLVQESSISGLQSKTHMKLMLKWMRGRNMLKLLCTEDKKFVHLTLPDPHPQIKPNQ